MHKLRLGLAKLSVRVPLIDRIIVAPCSRMAQRNRLLLERRPHRSFRRTRRRDYVRSLKLPGYFAFTGTILRTLAERKKMFFGLAAIYAVLSGVLVGIGSQDTFNQLASLFEGNDLFASGWGHVSQAGLLLVATVAHNATNPSPSSVQIVVAILLVLMVWLTTVWLLRAQMAGKHPRLRDGLYSAGSPLVAMAIVGFFAIVQLIPFAIGVLAVNVLSGYEGAFAMVVWFFACALMALSLYWVTSTFFAAIIVALPGVYPWQAMRAAGDLVVGRRVRILLRILWGVLCIVVSWLIIMTPIILLDIWIGSLWQPFASAPIIPITLLVLASITLVWFSAYIYILYRRIVDDDAAPA